MTFTTPAQRSRNSAPNSGLMKTPDYLEKLVHKPLRAVDWGNKKNQAKELRRREKLRILERRINHNKMREQKNGQYLFSPFRMKRLISIFCRLKAIGHKTLISQMRTREVTEKRQIIMWILHKNTCQSFPSIAREFGGRCHTTVLHAVRKITNTPELHKKALEVERMVLFFEHETYGDTAQ